MPDDTQQAIPAVPSPAAGDEPHEHHMHLLGRYYRQVEAGRKTIEVRVATAKKRAVAAGDTVVFHDRDTGRELDVIVERITPYPCSHGPGTRGRRGPGHGGIDAQDGIALTAEPGDVVVMHQTGGTHCPPGALDAIGEPRDQSRRTSEPCGTCPFLIGRASCPRTP